MAAKRGRPTKRRRYTPPPPPQQAPAVTPAAAAAAAEAEAALRALELEASVASAELSIMLHGAEDEADGDVDEDVDEEESEGAAWLAQVEELDALLVELRARRAAAEAPWDEAVGGGFGRGSVGPPKHAAPEEGVGVALTVERMAQAAVGADIGELILLSQHKRRLLQFASGRGYTPLTTGAARGYFQLVLFLLDTRVPVNMLDGLGATPLFHAALAGHDDIVRLLLGQGARRDALGHTPTGANALHGAAAGGAVVVIQTLLEHGWDAGGWEEEWVEEEGDDDEEDYDDDDDDGDENFINWPDAGGRTALWLAAANGRAAAVAFLLRRGADPLIADAAGVLPRQAAAAGGHADCVAPLEGAEKRYRLLQARAFVSAELQAAGRAAKTTTTAAAAAAATGAPAAASHAGGNTKTTSSNNNDSAIPAWATRRLALGRPLPRVDAAAAAASDLSPAAAGGGPQQQQEGEEEGREAATFEYVVRTLPSEIFVELVEAIGESFACV